MTNDNHIVQGLNTAELSSSSSNALFWQCSNVPNLCEIYTVDMNTGIRTAVISRTGKVYGWPRLSLDGNALILIRGREISKFSLKTGASSKLDVLGIDNIVSPYELQSKKLVYFEKMCRSPLDRFCPKLIFVEGANSSEALDPFIEIGGIAEASGDLYVGGTVVDKRSGSLSTSITSGVWRISLTGMTTSRILLDGVTDLAWPTSSDRKGLFLTGYTKRGLTLFQLLPTKTRSIVVPQNVQANGVRGFTVGDHGNMALMLQVASDDNRSGTILYKYDFEKDAWSDVKLPSIASRTLTLQD